MSSLYFSYLIISSVYAYEVGKSINLLKEKGKKVIAYGAASKVTTVFNYCGIDNSLIEYITDTTPSKIGKHQPGTHIPIISPEEGFDNTVDYAFLGAWNFAKEIQDKEEFFTGRFFTHVPSVGLIE